MMVMAFQSSPILSLPRASPGSRASLLLFISNARSQESQMSHGGDHSK
jgi:hypothetical protein